MKHSVKLCMAALTCLCLLAGCMPKERDSSVPQDPPASSGSSAAAPADTQPAVPLDPLTGVTRDAACTRRPYAVTFYNSPSALPQWGIGSAQIVIECLTEGNTTYQTGLFSGETALPKVGPVGPARDTLLQFAMGDNAIPVHIGQNNYAWNLLNQYAYQDINGWYVGVSVFDMDWDRNATVSDELCWYTRQETLNNGLTSTGVAQDSTVPGAFHFATSAAVPANLAATLYQRTEGAVQVACINTLGAYLTAHNARERTQRSALLAERQKQILSFAHDQTRLHLQRIADNNSLSIETSALHLEILSLFNRMANLVCACANLEVERN